MMSKRLRYACLFSGIGAPLQGAYRVYGKENIDHVFSCEFDKFARQSFEANYDIEPQHFHKDVHDLNATQYKEQVDILIGGSPCQAFSLAGLRHGTADVRGQLIYQYIRVVDECRPEVIVYENVKGIMSIDNGNTIKDFVQALRDIGYHCHYSVVNTKNYGVPQNRERLFLVGFLDHDVYHRFHFAPKVTLEKRLKDVLEDDVNEKYYLDRDFEFIENSRSIVAKLTDTKFESAQRIRNIHGVAPTIVTQQGGDQELKILLVANINPSGNGMNGWVYDEAGLAPTLTTNKGEGIKITDFFRVRRTTPREHLRLQGFPDSFKIITSDTQEYIRSGNSMSVNILEMIFNQIEKAKVGECRNSLLDFMGENNG